MHISIGAAILILGLLFLGTSPAGRRVLAWVSGSILVLIVVLGTAGVLLNMRYERIQAEHAAAEHAAQLAACEKYDHATGRAGAIPLDEAYKCDQLRGDHKFLEGIP
jgi:hypothetical protein